MPPLVGDVIIDARLLGPPDPPATLTAPSASAVTFSLVAAGANPPLPAGQVFLVASYTNPWGQTQVGPEVSLTPSGSQVVQVSGILGFATGVNVFIGAASGAETALLSFSALPGLITGGTVVGYPAASTSSAPPLRSSAWLPDTDGAFAPASLVYRWLNKGLEEAAKIAGGIPDETGAATVATQNSYTIPGTWKQFSKGFYDGYEIFLGSASDNWYQSSITSLAWNLVCRTWAENPRMEIFPQAQRTSGTGTLSAPLAATNVTAANVAFSTPGFVVPVGLAIIGQQGGPPGSYEIVSYTNFSTTQLTSLGRALGGTSALAWPVGTPVAELNIHLWGRRYPNTFAVGNSALSLGIPIEWAAPLVDYVTAQFKLAEHEAQEHQRLMTNFTSNMAQWGNQNNQRTGRKQQGGVGGIPGVYFASQFHGVIVP
jgi:hypothetical protein